VIRPTRRRAAAPVLILLLLATAGIEAGKAQRAPRRAVSGPSAKPAPALNDERVYVLLRRQLRALLAAQDSVRAERGGYALGFGTAGESVAFLPPPGVTINLTWADSGGWTASASHAALPGKNCVIWAGQVPPPRRPVTRADSNRGGEAEVVCDLVP